MSKMIQIRNVPEGLHRVLKSRAALEGLSLSEYLLRLLEQSASKPTLEELMERIRKRPLGPPDHDPTDDVVRHIRERRGE